tara:strand:- start:84 stop:755 length:672 start_codon:yes stop_codon:yes gene_type:complete
MAYGVEFLQGTKGATYAAGWRIQTSGVVDNGTIVKAGNVVTGGPAADLSLGSLADDFGTSFGSKIVAQADTGDKAGVSKAVSAGTLAFSASSTQWIMRGGNVTATIGGVANTTLAGGGRDYNNKINTFSEEVARTKISDRLIGSKADEAFDMYARPSADIVPGRTRGTNHGVASTMANPADGTAAVASEIAPSQAVPGELTYHFGALGKATTDEYKAKNELEA